LVLTRGIFTQKIGLDRRGFGKKVFSFLANLALERNYLRMDWCVLDWNKPSIEFYKSLGAKALGEWTIYRLDESALKKISEKSG